MPELRDVGGAGAECTLADAVILAPRAAAAADHGDRTGVRAGEAVARRVRGLPQCVTGEQPATGWDDTGSRDGSTELILLRRGSPDATSGWIGSSERRLAVAGGARRPVRPRSSCARACAPARRDGRLLPRGAAPRSGTALALHSTSRRCPSWFRATASFP
ncbi:MAG: hypothetical protein MZV64_72370 [Ignavibacteriales bacterium]|nr:hypothetical protein [Ignavibacteriales bacterium]